MADMFFLTEDDRKILQRLIDREKGRVSNPVMRGGYGLPNMETDMFPPEVYVARTPPDGIPELLLDPSAGIEDRPGYADCGIYRIIGEGITGELQRVQVAVKRIYNLSREKIGGNRWVLVARDKYGRWFATTTVISDVDLGTGTGTAEDIDHDFFACPSFSFTIYRYECEPVSDIHVMTTSTPGTGTTSPSQQNLLNEYGQNIFLIPAVNGCPIIVKSLWRFIRTIACCDTICADRSWYCLDAKEDTGTGTGTGTGPGDSTLVGCCPDPIRNTLRLTVVDTTLCCMAEGTTYTLIYNSVTGKWQSSSVACGIQNIMWRLGCDSFTGIWTLEVTCNEGVFWGTGEPTSPSCDPFLLNFDFINAGIGGSCCPADESTFNVVITE